MGLLIKWMKSQNESWNKQSQIVAKNAHMFFFTRVKAFTKTHFFSCVTKRKYTYCIICELLSCLYAVKIGKKTEKTKKSQKIPKIPKIHQERFGKSILTYFDDLGNFWTKRIHSGPVCSGRYISRVPKMGWNLVYTVSTSKSGTTLEAYNLAIFSQNSLKLWHSGQYISGVPKMGKKNGVFTMHQQIRHLFKGL